MRHWLKQFRQLRDLGVVGLNQRNTRYIGRFNDRAHYPLVDDKLSTKMLAIQNNVSTPKLITTIETQRDVNRFTDLIGEAKGFAIKPSKGSGGKGILLVRQTEPGVYRRLSGEPLSNGQIKLDLSNILSGLYSLGGKPDTAVIEELLEPDEAMTQFCQRGVPDIRVIVFQGFPVMAMVRMPTTDSDGKANLHQGAVGIGITIDTGKASLATQYNRKIVRHPDTHLLLSDLRIADWPQLLELSSRCFDMTQLGYLGVDLVIDKHHGPMLLELNARPGLSIQLANGIGLQPRLKAIEALNLKSFADAKARVEFSQRQFS